MLLSRQRLKCVMRRGWPAGLRRRRLSALLVRPVGSGCRCPAQPGFEGDFLLRLYTDHAANARELIKDVPTKHWYCRYPKGALTVTVVSASALQKQARRWHSMLQHLRLSRSGCAASAAEYPWQRGGSVCCRLLRRHQVAHTRRARYRVGVCERAGRKPPVRAADARRVRTRCAAKVEQRACLLHQEPSCCHVQGEDLQSELDSCTFPLMAAAES